MAFTYFFRDLHTLELTVRHVTAYVSGRSRVRVWDAGCAMGPEPFSLAILFAENMGPFAFRNLRIEATDIDESNLFGPLIREGVYREGDLQRIPEELFARYFRPDCTPGCYRLVEEVRSRVGFERHDLLSLRPVGDGFSLVVCKNVLLHFQLDQRVEVLRMFHRSLAPGGYLTLEQTQKLPDEMIGLFEAVTTDARLFRKVEAA